MSNNISRYVPKLNDRDVIRAFESVASKFASDVTSLSFQDSLGDPGSEGTEKYKKLHGFFLTIASMRAGHCSWQWTRLRVEHNDPHNAMHDKLTFNWNPQQGQPDRLVVASVGAALDAALSRPLASIEGGGVDPSRGISHSDVLMAMESTAAKVLTDAASHRQTLEAGYLQKEEVLNTRVDELRERELARISEEKSRIESEFSARKVILDERQNALDELQKTLDDRNNTHVRRDIRSSLLALTKDRLANFAVSKETRVQYFAVHLVAVAGLVVLASGAIWYGAQIIADASGNYPAAVIALAIKSGALAAAAIALGSWYLGWLNRWLQRIADAEFKLQQFRLDIERASWLAETVLEWKATSQEPFPELLASRLSTGLFHSSSTDVEDPKTPASHLAEALFGAASSVKLKLGEQEVNLDRRAIKKLDN